MGYFKEEYIIKTLEQLKQDVIEWNNICRKEPICETLQQLIVEEELKEYGKAVEEQDFVEIFDAIADIYFTGAYMEHLYPNNVTVNLYKAVVEQAIEDYGYDLVAEVIEEVIRSNYTKFTPYDNAGNTDPNKEREYIEDKTNDFIRVYVNKGYFVYLNERNKVMKPSHYVAPDIKSILNKYNKK